MNMLSSAANGASAMVNRHVLCVTSNLPRWAGDSTTPFVLNLVQDLMQLGWQVDVLAPHAPNAAFQECLDGVPVERFRYLWPSSLQTLCYGGGALINLRKNRFNWFKLPPLIIAETASVAARLAKRRYALIHSHWILPQGLIGTLLAKPFRTPHVVTVHGGDIFGLQGWAMGRLKRIALHGADAVTVNSSTTARAVNRLCPELSGLHQIPMGANIPALCHSEPQVQDIRARYKCGEGPLLLFVGRLIEEKGVDDFIAAVAILVRTIPHLRGLIIGSGQDEARFRRHCDALGLGEHITFTGWLNPSAVAVHMSAADMLIGPSRTAQNGWKEAQGLVFIEAMLSDTLVIATRNGGITDLVTHEKTGILVDEHAPEQIARAVKQALNDPFSVARMCQTAKELALSQYSRAKSAERFSQLFASVISASHADATRDGQQYRSPH